MQGLCTESCARIQFLSNRDHVDGYALSCGLCVLVKKGYAWGYARVMRIISLGPPLHLDTVGL